MLQKGEQGSLFHVSKQTTCLCPQFCFCLSLGCCVYSTLQCKKLRNSKNANRKNNARQVKFNTLHNIHFSRLECTWYLLTFPWCGLNSMLALKIWVPFREPFQGCMICNFNVSMPQRCQSSLLRNSTIDTELDSLKACGAWAFDIWFRRWQLKHVSCNCN